MFDSLKFMEIILNDNFLFLKKNMFIFLKYWNYKFIILRYFCKWCNMFNFYYIRL